MTMDLQVTGMTCEHCVNAVTRALQSVPGVEKVAVNLAGGRARVEGAADPKALVKALDDQGYEAILLAD